KGAHANFARYLEDGLLKKQINELAMKKYLENADLSLKAAYELMASSLKPYLWVIVVSYYAMFYSANAVLLHLGYKTQEKIAHKVTSDALIVLVLDKVKKELMEDYEAMQEDALEIANARADALIESYSLELEKRSRFQYEMLEEMKASRAQTSLKRASEFVFEMKKLLK
ncbi:MAG: hypothetical protein WC595_04570, partial [Candidatus Nanoarchaeia archaeon]